MIKKKRTQDELIKLVKILEKNDKFTEKELDLLLRKFTKINGDMFSRDELIGAIRKHFPDNLKLISSLKLKPTRTISGVTTVTVLTKPFACPGRCIFCPNDVRMPKSYIASEPGAQRALMFKFSPYIQVFNRLVAYKNIGHPTDKVELLVLGGTWSYYPEKYRIWFITECFRAMNDFNAKSVTVFENRFINVKEYLKQDFNSNLRKKVGDKPYNQLLQTAEYKSKFESKFVEKEEFLQKTIAELRQRLFLEQEKNSNGLTRCVGLVLETRPDCITEKEVLSLRELGATKIQLGIQTLDNKVSALNKRGETKEDVITAFSLLRSAGFKIHAHIMPNLYGSNPEQDFDVYQELFDNPAFKPDELKIYPTSIIRDTENFELFQQGKYRPYTLEELSTLLANCIEYTPEYCRLTRIIRDIPSQEIEAGNKVTNLREVVEKKLRAEKRLDKNIRAREIRSKKVTIKDLHLDILSYTTTVSKELFLQYITLDRKLAGFLRLSLPHKNANPITKELDDCAIIREIHVYGPSLELSNSSKGEAQHLGLGTKLIEEAKTITKKNGFKKLAVISSIGTREYYKKRGFKLGAMYQVCKLI